MSMRLNPPLGWPPVPSGWEPPAGWQPDAFWPDPPPGWQLWVEYTDARARQIRAATWTIAGGGATFLGSLLPFLTSSQPDLYTINSSPKESAAVFGIILAVLGVIIMRATSRRTILITGILAIIIATLILLTLARHHCRWVCGYRRDKSNRNYDPCQLLSQRRGCPLDPGLHRGRNRRHHVRPASLAQWRGTHHQRAIPGTRHRAYPGKLHRHRL